MKKRGFPLTNNITKAFLEFVQGQKFTGVLLIFCTVLSLLLANGSISESYLHFWHHEIKLSVSDLSSSMSIGHFINDALMAIFFLLVGLEIKRELKAGELSSFYKASLPVAAAIGGMVVPAAIYVFFNSGTQAASGWGIPMATDIAFAIGVLTLLGNRVPDSLKILLTALAVVDDLGAVSVIAIFYTQDLATDYLIYASGILFMLFILNRFNVKYIFIYILLGIALWYFILMSGVHATVAGVLLAFMIPFDENNEKNPLLQLEHGLQFPVNYFIMPLFALANTAIVISPGFLENLNSSESYGIGLGLLLGKPLGIVFFLWLALKLKIGKMPAGTNFRQFWGIGFLGGIGFTMSIFITLLAFDNEAFIVNGKISVLIASLFAGIIGFLLMKQATRKNA